MQNEASSIEKPAGDDRCESEDQLVAKDVGGKSVLP
jgi:hypothetical protein